MARLDVNYKNIRYYGVISVSIGRRILLFPLTRLVIWLIVTAAIAVPLAPLPFLRQTGIPGAENMVSAIATTLGLLTVVLLVERRSVREAGFGRSGCLRNTGWGLLLGGGLMALVIGLMALAGWYRLLGTGWGEPSLARRLTEMLLVFLWVAIAEEVAMRGVFFRLLEECLGSWAALLLSSLVFGLMHLGNPHASWAAALAIAAEAGLLLGGAYMLTRDLWLPIGIHWAWNFVQGPVFGAAVSGSADGGGVIQSGLLRPVLQGPALWTGGGFGPEASLLTLLVCTVAGVLMVYTAVRRGNWRAPAWRRPSRPST